MTQLELAERYITSTNVSLFLTGKAGTGKTTFLHHIASTVKKRFVVLAPTGVAAVNAAGVTIHSFFQLPLCPYLPDVKELVTEYQMPDKFKSLRKEKMRIIRTLDLVIIDEISMVRADLLDAVDMTLRRYRRNSKPFGGVQLLMIGDVQQLPPVVTDDEKPYLERVYPSPFFFHSKALQRLRYITIELKEVFRQQDQQLIGLLNNIRENRFDASTLSALNARCQPRFDPPDSEGYIRLTTHNYQSDSVNRRKLDALPSRPVELKASVEGIFPESSFPTEGNLVLKKGAQVMFVKNDSLGGAYFNGKIATVEGYDEENGVAVVDREGNHIVVARERWENIRYEVDPVDNQIKQVVDGTFTQYPLRLAWAITIHKSQGLTFDRVIIDAASAFTYGQVYVALSRCRSLEGLVLATPISSRCVFDNADVLQFNESFTPQQQAEQELGTFQSTYFFEMLYELFDFSAIFRSADRLNGLFQQHLRRLFPIQTLKMSELFNGQIVNILTVSEKFHKQLSSLSQTIGKASANEHLNERIAKGVEYFKGQLESVYLTAAPLLEVESKNKAVAKDFKEYADDFRDAVGLKQRCLERVGADGFSPEVLNQAKVDFLLEKEPAKPSRKRPQQAAKQPFWMESVRLFSQGLSIEQVASERKMAASTIASHLQKALEAGVLDIDQFLTSEELDEIMEYIVEDKPQTLTEIYQHFNGKYPYPKLRAAQFASRELLA